MSLSSLAGLGKVAGLGGIALGVVLLLFHRIISQASSVPAAQRAPLLRFVAIGAFGIGAIGIIAWVISGPQGGNITATGGGVAAGGDISGPISTSGAPSISAVAKVP